MRRVKFSSTEFGRYGYSLARGFYSQTVISRVIDWIDGVKDASDNCNLIRIYDKSIDGEMILNRIENTINDECETIKRLLLSSELMDLLAGVFNGNSASLFKDKLNFKYPGCRADLVHQDQASGWSKYANYFVSVCVCIDENTEHNGALRFLSTGEYPKELQTEEWEPFTSIDPALLPSNEYKVIAMTPGDIVVFDSYIPHGSAANYGDISRRNLFMTFNDSTKGEFRKRYYKDRAKHYPTGSSIKRRIHQ